MTEYKLHKVLLHIAKKSYPSNPIEQFYVKYSIKEYKKEEYYGESFHFGFFIYRLNV